MISPNFTNENLLEAAEAGDVDRVETLIDQGADVNFRQRGHTPLYLAAKYGRIPVVELLIKKGSYVNTRNDSSGSTHLHVAARQGNEHVISLFLAHGSKPNAKDRFGFTPLHIAAMYGSLKVTVALLNNGAVIDETNAQGKTAMDLAHENNQKTVIQLYQKILSSGLPKELMYLSNQDSDSFTSNLRAGYYLSYVGKIMCVGNESVGKTALTSVLRAKKPRKKRESTEGLDLHIFRAAVDLDRKKWISQGLDLEKIAFRDLLNKPTVEVSTLENIEEIIDNESIDENNFDERSDEEFERGNSLEKLENPMVHGRRTLRSHHFNPGSTLHRIKQKLGLEKAFIRTAEEIQKEAIRKGKKGLINSSLAPVNMMDFGGQTAFYSTHQSFLTYRGIYILVLDGSKGFDEELETELFIPGMYGKPTSRKFTLFWVSSIESYSKGGSDLFPKILVVCTHRDKVPKHEVDLKLNTILAEIEDMFKDTAAMKHLVLENRIFLNALDSEDPGYDRLKEVLVELLCSQPSWGEKLPKAWIHLKLMINRTVEGGDNIISMQTLRSINLENPVQVLSENDLKLFLKMHHSQGEIIYFPLPGLKEHIVISPKFLVDALRSLVTDKRFCKGHRLQTIESMSRNGLLHLEDIRTIWKGNKQFLRYKEYLLPLMKHLDILATPRKYDRSGEYMRSDFYYVPSLVKTADDTQYLQESHCSNILGLSFKFHSKVLPPAIGYRLIASCVNMFEIKNYNGTVMLFSGMVVVSVKRHLDMAVILRSERVDIFLVHHLSRFHIVQDTASGIAECLKDILTSILEIYRVISSEATRSPDLPFHIEYPCFNMISPCYNQDKNEWKCSHDHNITKEIKAKWRINRRIESCMPDCEGLIGTDLFGAPSELQLAKLALQFTWMDFYALAIRIGLKDTEINAFRDDYGTNLLNVAFLCLRKWRLKTNGTVSDLVKAIKDMELDIHKACKMIRNKPLACVDKILSTDPTDKILDAICNEVITESLFLSIELGHNASLWLGMKDNREKIVEINREVLKRWKSEHPRKDQMKDLAQALCNVGLNITTFIDNE